MKNSYLKCDFKLKIQINFEDLYSFELYVSDTQKANKRVITSNKGDRILCSDGSKAFFYIQRI